MADHDEKPLTSKMLQGHRKSQLLTGHYLSPAFETVTDIGGSASAFFNLQSPSCTLLTVNVSKREVVRRNEEVDSTRAILKWLPSRSSMLEETVSTLRSRYVLEFKKQDIPLMGKAPGGLHSTASSATVA